MAAKPPTLPTRTTWYLTDLAKARGEKTETVRAAIVRPVSTFRVADLRSECPGVGMDLIRQLLARLQKEKKINPPGTGRGAKWERTGNQVSNPDPS